MVATKNNEFEQAVEQAKKASVILLALGGTLSSSLIKEFKTDEIKRFAQSATALQQIDPDYLITLVEELSSEMRKSDPLTGGELQTRTFLDEALPSGKVQAVYGNNIKAELDIWKDFSSGSESMLTPYLLDEHPQTIAFILSKLSSELSPRIIATLPRGIRNTIVMRLLKIRPVEKSYDQIAQVNLQNDLLFKADNTAELEGRKRIAKLLNNMEKENIDAILNELKGVAPVEATEIRRMLFSFEDIIQLDQKDRLALFDKVQTDQVMLALRGAQPDLKEAILAAIGARARRMIEAELAEISNDITKEVKSARQNISETALRLAAEGIINLNQPSDTAEGVMNAGENS